MNRAAKEARKHPEKNAPPELHIDFQDTPEKFQSMAGEILPPLIELLRRLCGLEEEMHSRSVRLRKSRPGGLYSTEAHPDMDALWQEYRDRYHALLDPHCTEKFLAARRDCCQSIVTFTMKSPSKAIVIVPGGVLGLDTRFELRPDGGSWKIDRAAFRHSNDPKWRTEYYM